MKKIPIGISGIKPIINENYVYVDKTKEIKYLIDTYRYSFFSRPRRFGKSLTIDIVETLFTYGVDPYFKDSYIEFYKLSECVLSSSLSEGVITKVLPTPYKTIKGPMLLNGLDLNSTKEKVLIISTSGSSKYIFGSMFFSNKIRELTIS